VYLLVVDEGCNYHELVFRPDLYIVARLELPISHMIFFHSQERGICVGFAITVSFAKDILRILIFLKAREQISAECADGFRKWLVLWLVLQRDF
jgi:hypothetical protein